MSAPQVVSTEGIPERDRMAFWVEVVCEAFLEVKVASKAGPNFRGRIEKHPFGPLALFFMSFDDQHIERTYQGISRGKRNEFYLIQTRHKPVRLVQLGREVELAPGACTLIDSRHPYTVDNEADRDVFAVGVPTDWLLTWLPTPEDVVAQQWEPGREWGGVLASALANLTPRSIASLPLPPSVLCDQLGALVAMAAAGGPDPPVQVRPTLLDRLRDTLKGSYHEHGFNPSEVARHHGISLRYLHLQFAAARTSFGAELLETRLTNARRMLGDRRCDRLSVSEVALRCGFGNSSHFARRFRERYGHSPTELRSQCRD